jgi:hypothetical protein
LTVIAVVSVSAVLYGLNTAQKEATMRYRELTTPEWERRHEELIADRIYAALNNSRISRQAVAAGSKQGWGRFVASLKPGRQAQQERLRARQALRDAEHRAKAAGVDIDTK